MENLQGTIKRIFIFITLFITVLCGNIYAQTIDGKVTLKIEHKTLSLQEAQRYIQQQTPVYLKVSMIMEGEWVTYLEDARPSRGVYIGSSQFAYAVATTDGTTRADAPFDKNPNVWLLSNLENCVAAGTPPLYIGDIVGYPKYYIPTTRWNVKACPTYAYGLIFYNEGSSMQDAGNNKRKGSYTDDKGVEHEYYEIDLFPIAFYLKNTSTIYVRGVDVSGALATDPDDDETRDGEASTGATEINIYNNNGIAFTMKGEAGDWTYGSSARYGGIIPGGIFIEQSPEVAQLTPNFFA